MATKRRDEMERLRGLSVEEINDETVRLKESLFRTKFKAALGELDGIKNIKSERRQVARLQTLATQRKREQEAAS